MGQVTDANIAAWQRQAGIEPATGARAEGLAELQVQALDLIRVVELERSGIRDGDGSWHGSDALAGTVLRLHEIWQRIDREARESKIDRGYGVVWENGQPRAVSQRERFAPAEIPF